MPKKTVILREKKFVKHFSHHRHDHIGRGLFHETDYYLPVESQAKVEEIKQTRQMNLNPKKKPTLSLYL